MNPNLAALVAEEKAIMADEWAAWRNVVDARAAVDRAAAGDGGAWGPAVRAFGLAIIDYGEAFVVIGARVDAWTERINRL